MLLRNGTCMHRLSGKPGNTRRIQQKIWVLVGAPSKQTMCIFIHTNKQCYMLKNYYITSEGDRYSDLYSCPTR